MKICYCDETGTGDEPIAVMVGVVVDCTRMHKTKAHWQELLDYLSETIGRTVSEIHTRDFYAGNGPWRGMNGRQRTAVIEGICRWFVDRRHSVVYASVNKAAYFDSRKAGLIPPELNTLWRFAGFHLILAMQKACQCIEKNKGNTIFVFDNEGREEMRFVDLIANPPSWSDEYYSREKKQDALDQVVDVPYFGDSKEVGLVQLADFMAFFLRRYAEIHEGHLEPRYEGEADRVGQWARVIADSSIGGQHIYPRKKRCKVADMYYQHASPAIREL